MSDAVLISGLRVAGRVGVTVEERAEPQPLRIDVSVAADLRVAGHSDELGDTIDYGDLATRVAKLVASTEARLLETLAERISALILADERVGSVTVEITKERPPLDLDLAGTGVRIERAR